MPEAACTVKEKTPDDELPESSKHVEWMTTTPEMKDGPKVSSCW